MENPIQVAELKPIVEEAEPSMMRSEDYMVKGKQTLMPPLRKHRHYQVRNMPELEPSAKSCDIDAFFLMAFGLTCNSCGHIMPKLSKVAGYFDVFSIPGCKREKQKQHMYCPKCSAEIVMENWKVISGATKYPPGLWRVK